jgi:hypothetical protein
LSREFEARIEELAVMPDAMYSDLKTALAQVCD